MASESTEERSLSVSIPAELDEWLDKEAARLDVDRNTLFVQLLASYRTTAELDGEDGVPTVDQADVAEAVDEQLQSSLEEQIETILAENLDEQIVPRVTEQVQEQLTETIEERTQEQVQAAVESVVTDRISEATNSVQRQLDNRIDTVEDDYKEKLEDVRERVIQVKKETDAKAQVGHAHDEFDRLEDLSAAVSTLETDLEQLQEHYDETVPDHEQKVAEFDERIGQIEDRLQTVAWVVSDLRDAHESSGGLEAVERIKRAAAKANIERANCQNCGEEVSLGLLTDPECPHCNATVSNVEPAGGWFGNPKLLVASQLESGEQS